MTLNFDPRTLKSHNILIESGTFKGEFTERARKWYKRVHTIEVVPDFFHTAQAKFEGTNVICHLGDSPIVIQKLLTVIDEPVTFWLDAHYQGGRQPSGTEKPLLRELAAIAGHHIKDHMIMIDDVRLFHLYDTSVEEVRTVLLAINPDYKIVFGDGVIKDDILIAH